MSRDAVPIWIACLLVACGSPSTSTSSEACAARVALFESRVAAVSTGAWTIGTPAGIELAHTSAGAARSPLGPTGAIASDGTLSFDGRPMPTLQAFGEDLGTMTRNWSILHPGHRAPDEVGIFADRRAHVSDLRRVAGVHTTIPVVLLLLDASAPATPPACPTSLGDACAVIASGDRDARAALPPQFPRIHGTCAAIPELFHSLPEMDWVARDRAFRAGAPRAVAACECGSGLDVDAFEYLTLVELGALDPWLRVVPMPAMTDADDASSIGEFLDHVLAAH